MTRSARWLVGAGIGLVFGAVGGPARAEWPVARHDPARTAYAAGTSSITKPTVYWENYLGGTLSGSTHVARDVDGDGIVDVLYLAGGKAIVKHADDRIVWETTPLDFTQIHGVADVDGDGILEIVVGSTRNVFLLSGQTGKVLWKNPDGEVGNIGGVRLADLDGDGRPEVLIDDCACCGVTATASPPGGVYHFAAGAMATKLYAPATRSHCGSDAVTIGDFDADGVGDVAYGDASTVILTSGKTGAALSTSGTLGQDIYYSSCVTANVDGRPGDELVCFQNVYYASTGMGGRRLFTVTYDTSATPAAKTLYDLAPVPADTGQLLWVGNSLTDLDGDGLLEIAVSWNDGTAWSTVVHDAKTGAMLATIAEKLEGIVDVDGDKLPEIVTTTAAGLVARKFSRAATPPLSQAATFPAGYHVRSQWSFAQAALGAIVGQPLAIDLQGNGDVVPVFFIAAKGTTPASYVAVEVKGGTASTLATYTVPSGISILTNQVYDKINRPYPQLVLARNDGYLVFLDNTFTPTNGGTFGSTEFPVVLPGMRVGGFIGSPIAPRLGGSADAVVVTDSRGYLVDLDASSAWMAVPPKTAWSLASASSPSTSPTLDNGKPGIVCTGGSGLTALRADGTQIWAHALPSGATLQFDSLSGDVNGDGTSDVFAAYTTAGSQINLQVFDGKTGNPVWASPYSEALQWGYEPFALADHDGNGIPDMYVVPNTLRVLSGASGATLAQNATFYGYFTPAIQDVDFDGVPDVTLSRGYYPARTFEHDLTTALWTGADDRPYQHGARAACAGNVSVWVQPSTQTQGMVRFVTMNGAMAGTAQTVFLAGGVAYPDAASAGAAGKFLGALGDVVVKQDLLGTGDHPSAVLGSSDGFVYAMNPCKATVDWALDMKFAVGNPIFADPTGSGVDQLLVPAADGYVHAVQEQVLPAPVFVNDNAASGGSCIVGPDLDTVATVDTLAASWAPVTGADGYQVAALTEGGTFVTQPDWVTIDNTTSTAVANLSLTPGKKYFFAVRAISKTKGSSPETVSNGVIVETPDGGGFGDAGFPAGAGGGVTGTGGSSAAGTGGGIARPPNNLGCGCGVAGSEGLAGAAAAVSMALIAIGARRRRARLAPPP